MSFATHFARALVPAAIIVAPAPAAAAPADIAKVEGHLKAVQSMTANFVQKDAKGRSVSGTMQMKRPGRVRFQYGGGANMLLVADGKRLTFIDYEVGQKSDWDLRKTPLGILLGSNPNVRSLIRQQASDDPRILVVKARDINRPEYGTLLLAFVREAAAPGGLRLYGWTAIDAQNKRTTVSLSNVRYNVAVPDRAFTFAEPKKRR